MPDIYAMPQRVAEVEQVLDRAGLPHVPISVQQLEEKIIRVNAPLPENIRKEIAAIPGVRFPDPKPKS